MAEPVSESPSPSSAVALHVMRSPGDAVVVVNAILAPVPISVEPLSHWYVHVKAVVPSASVALAEQVRLVEVVTPVSGMMVTSVTTGAVFSMVTVAEAESLPPSVSLAVALQLTVSPGETRALVNVILALVPISVVPLSH